MSEPAPTVIRFYTTTGEYGCFSNFSRHSIWLDEKRWPTSEHYFQAQKFAGTDHAEDVRRAPTPMRAAEIGRDRKRPFRSDWDAVKERVMLAALRAKFTQHADLKAILLGTGDAELVEHTANDNYWGNGGDGSGQNRLGALLMQVRDEIRAAGVS
ncbi:NADAR family protein [bacterium]|nr:NADAR family protein [bacterium]